MIYLRLGILLAAFFAGWGVNGWRLNSEFTTYRLAVETASKAAIEQARQTEQKWNAKINQEREDAAKRETQLRADADSAHAANDGLREQLSATARRLAEGTLGACVDTAAAEGELLANCAARHSELAEKADRHVSDIETLIGSWPK